MRLNRQKILSGSSIAVILSAALFWCLGFWFISSEKNEHKRLYLEKQTEGQKIAWDSVINTHRVGMAAYFEAYIDKPEVSKLLAVANGGSEVAKAKARSALLTLLSPIYERLQDRNVRQLHFHDKNNNSFLRFHQPHSFGDSLNASRPSVVLINKNKKPIQGFETGRVVSGFRNIFPLSYMGEHIGSVELSQPFEALRGELKELDKNKESIMTLKASQILPKLINENQKYYTRTGFSDDWLIEDAEGTIRGGKKAISDSSKKICKEVKNSLKFKALMNSGVPFSYEVTLDGGKKYAVTATPVIDIEGSYAAALLSFMHSPELEAVESAFQTQLLYFSLMLFFVVLSLFRLINSRKTLELERKRLSTISQTMGEGMYVIGRDGRIKYINDAALLMLGLSTKECIGFIAHYLFHSHSKNSDTHLEECPIFKTMLTNEKYEGIDYFLRKKGDVFAVDVISSPLFEDGEVIGAVTVFRDITERIKLEESLRSLNEKLESRVEDEVAMRLESEAIFKVIFEKTPEGIVAITKNGEIKECNEAAAKMLGFEINEIIGKTLCDISPDIQPDSGFFCTNSQKLFLFNALNGETQHYEWTFISKNGSYRLVEVLLSLIVRGDNREVLAIWRDITKLKELQKDKEASQALLIQQSKLAELGMMIGAIAHQWKQPLNAVWLMTQNLKMTYDDGELTPQLMEQFKGEMGEQVKFMSQTIEDFRNFYKPSKDKTIFSLSVAIRSVLSLLRGQIEKEAIEIITEFEESVFVRGYESEFKQVILNIVNNAKDALSQTQKNDKVVKIQLYVEGETAKVDIFDNAGGIDEKLLVDGKIFEPYNTTKGEKGTGVGLSLSKTIVEKKMNGKISARNIDGGALFSIELHAQRGE